MFFFFFFLFFFIIRVALIATFHIVPVKAGLDVAIRPVIDPGFDLEGMAKVLSTKLPKQSFTAKVWVEGWLPENCKSEADTSNITYSDFEVYEVTYEDCRAPWIFCVHKEAPDSTDHIFNTFGQVPVGLRSLMSNLIAFPNTTNEPAGFVFGDVLGVGPGWWNPGLLTHELSHALDAQVCEDKLLGRDSPVYESCQDQQFSNSSLWRNAQKKDTVLPTGYANSSLGEDFAEIGRLSLTNKNIPGGLASLNNGTRLISNQLELYEKTFSQVIYPLGGRCVDKVQSSPPVDVSGSMRIRQRLGLSTRKPEIPNPPEINHRAYKRDWRHQRIEEHFDHKH